VKSRASSTYTTSAAEAWRQGIEPGEKAGEDNIAVEDFDTPKLSPGMMADESRYSQLPDPALRSRPSVPEFETKRMSVSSLYSLNSVRAGGPPSSAASANGSEAGTGSDCSSRHIYLCHLCHNIFVKPNRQPRDHKWPPANSARDPISCDRNCKTKCRTTW
jgi:hypothetical protein